MKEQSNIRTQGLILPQEEEYLQFCGQCGPLAEPLRNYCANRTTRSTRWVAAERSKPDDLVSSLKLLDTSVILFTLCRIDLYRSNLSIIEVSVHYRQAAFP